MEATFPTLIQVQLATMMCEPAEMPEARVELLPGVASTCSAVVLGGTLAAAVSRSGMLWDGPRSTSTSLPLLILFGMPVPSVLKAMLSEALPVPALLLDQSVAVSDWSASATDILGSSLASKP